MSPIKFGSLLTKVIGVLHAMEICDEFKELIMDID